MESIEEKLLRYPDLSADEQEEVDAHVDVHPELADLRREVRYLYSLFQDAAHAGRGAPDDEVLAYYALTRYLPGEEASPALQALRDRLEKEIAGTPVLRKRLDRLDRRLRELEAGSSALAHFERISGHSLDDAAQPAQPAPARVHALGWMRWSAAALAIMCVSYVGLWAASEATEAPFDELAAIPAEELSVEGYNLRLRGGGSNVDDPASSDALYLRALELIQQARRTTFGLFPSYEEAKLRQAAALLREVIAREEPGSFLHLESSYFLGKALLGLRRPDEAREAFQAVVHGAGRKAGKAEAILRQLE